MTVHLVAGRRRDLSIVDGRDSPPGLTCALVNNMPDGAFDATERQYLGLLEEGSGASEVEVRRYTVEGVPRGAQTSARIAEQYLPLSDIYRDEPDVLIVTGSNPIEERIQDEIYWEDLVELLSWARPRVNSILLSCLSAHAALTIFDGIDRVRLAEKCTGVFSQDVEVGRALTEGLDTEILLPHSRWNTVPRTALESAGYDVLVHSRATGWGVATRDEDGRQLVLIQGHPEYDPSSLLREYRRDAGRFVRRERDEIPSLPLHCVASEDWDLLERTHHEIVGGRLDPLVLDGFHFDEVGARAPWSWRSMATRLYGNWLTSVVHGKD